MSQPAIASSLLSFSPIPRRAAASFPARLPVSPPATPVLPARAPHPSQLLDWLRLAARQVFGAELAARLEPYRACRCCVAQVRWCGEGVPARSDPWLQSVRSSQPLPLLQEITPLTPALILGAKADPYSPAESAQRRTRRLLERLAGAPREIFGMEISILTRSPLLLRDLDLLVDLDRRHAVTVSVLIPAAEADLASRVEAAGPTPPSPPSLPSPPSVPSPDTRFELVRTLAAHGIATRVLCTPVQPGLNNGVAVLRRLFGRAREAGAFDVTPAPRHPALRPTAAESRQLLALFHRLRVERGFPRTVPGRG